jgi:hypothetical protein
MKYFIIEIVKEFFFATAFAACVGFVLAIFIESSRLGEQVMVFSIVLGAILFTMAKRSILSFIRQYQ